MKPAIITIAAAIIAITGVWFFLHHATAVLAPVQQTTADYKNGTYAIEGEQVTLVNGRAESASAPGSASKTVTTYFGNDATGDLNGDGVADAAFLLTQTTGGSGTFYYVVAALATANGHLGTNAILLGDRIAPQTTQIEDGELVVNYADRKAGEPMTADPSVGVSAYLRIVNGALVPVPLAEYKAGNLLLGTDATTTLGTYLIGSNGMTLYTYAKDAFGVSNCTDACAQKWPPYVVPTRDVLANVRANIMGAVDATARADGSLQVTYKGSPLYYYALDTASGSTTGNSVGKVWSVVKP